MKCFNLVLILSIAIIIDEARCGVIGSVYEDITNRTKAVKDDVYSWWSYGVDTIIGSDDNNPLRSINENAENMINRSKAEVEKESGMISGIYNKVKGGVNYGYMKVHDVVLGKDSDPNKGIIRTLYERAMHRLRQIRAYMFDGNIGISQVESQQIEDEREKVLKVLFGNTSNLFNTVNEKQALDSLRNKLTEAGDSNIHLLDNERDVIKKAYEYVHNKSDELKTEANKLSVNINDKAQESIDVTKDFIKDASNKASEGAQNLEENYKKSVNDMEKKLQSE